MTKEWAEKLVAALRSGQFEQGTGWLERDGKHCFLGVACVIAGADRGIFANMVGAMSFDGAFNTLPRSVVTRMGFSSTIGRRDDGRRIEIGNRDYEDLADANDCGCTFAQIADYIEQFGDSRLARFTGTQRPGTQWLPVCF